MARIVLGSYMVRYPLGGNLSWALQYLLGFQRLGHDVFFVEKSGWDNSCYNPTLDCMSNDCSYGLDVVNRILTGHGLRDRWCYVDAAGTYHGLSRDTIEAILRRADVFIDMGTHGSWLDEAATAGVRVFVDAEPGMRQMKMQKALDAGETLPPYDFYYTKGRSIASGRSSAPTVGLAWRGMFHPVVTEQFEVDAAPDGAPFTTVMNWQAYEPVEFRGTVYGHKDVEFDKFITLPSRTAAPLEVAIAGKNSPTREWAATVTLLTLSCRPEAGRCEGASQAATPSPSVLTRLMSTSVERISVAHDGVCQRPEYRSRHQPLPRWYGTGVVACELIQGVCSCKRRARHTHSSHILPKAR